jgi:hypothetical protein
MARFLSENVSYSEEHQYKNNSKHFFTVKGKQQYLEKQVLASQLFYLISRLYDVTEGQIKLTITKSTH